MIKAVRIKETFFDFLEDHPEINISTDKNGNLIIFPVVDDIEKWSCTIFMGHVTLFYHYHGTIVKFSD